MKTTLTNAFNNRITKFNPIANIKNKKDKSNSYAMIEIDKQQFLLDNIAVPKYQLFAKIML